MCRRATAVSGLGRIVRGTVGLGPLALIIVVFVLAAPVVAEPPDESSPRDALGRATGTRALLRFRRVYAPAQREEEWWPRGSARYVPVEAAEFDRLVRAARVGHGRAGRGWLEPG